MKNPFEGAGRNIKKVILTTVAGTMLASGVNAQSPDNLPKFKKPKNTNEFYKTDEKPPAPPKHPGKAAASSSAKQEQQKQQAQQEKIQLKETMSANDLHSYLGTHGFKLVSGGFGSGGNVHIVESLGKTKIEAEMNALNKAVGGYQAKYVLEPLGGFGQYSVILVTNQ